MTLREVQLARQRIVEDDPSSRATVIVDGVSLLEYGPIPSTPGIQSLPTEWAQALMVGDWTMGQTHRPISRQTDGQRTQQQETAQPRPIVPTKHVATHAPSVAPNSPNETRHP